MAEISIGGKTPAMRNVGKVSKYESMHMNIESPAEEEQAKSPPLQKVKRLTAARKKKYKQARWSRANN